MIIFIRMNMKQPNVKQIGAIINDLEIKPNYISSYFIECGMYSSKKRKVKGKDEFKKEKIAPIADRTFSDILKGKETKEKSLKALAELFSNLYKKNGKNKIISLSDISIEGEGPLKNNLRIVNNYNELINDRKSIYRIPFFNFDINDETEPKVNKLLELIDELYDFFSPSRLNMDENRYNLSQYSNELKKISEINSCLNFLSEKKIYLYSGVIKNIPIINTLSNRRTEQTDNPDFPEFEVFADVSVELNKTDFNIYYFTNSKMGNYIEAVYKTKFNYSQLEKEIKKNPFKKTYELNNDDKKTLDNFYEKADLDCAVFYGDIFLKKFNHTGLLPFNFERDKIEFVTQRTDYKDNYYKKGEDPELDEYLEENNLTYEEFMEQEADRYTQMQIDISRGK